VTLKVYPHSTRSTRLSFIHNNRRISLLAATTSFRQARCTTPNFSSGTHLLSTKAHAVQSKAAVALFIAMVSYLDLDDVWDIRSNLDDRLSLPLHNTSHPGSSTSTKSVTFQSWDPRILNILPNSLAAEFPARLTHHSAISNDLFKWMRAFLTTFRAGYTTKVAWVGFGDCMRA